MARPQPGTVIQGKRETPVDAQAAIDTPLEGNIHVTSGPFSQTDDENGNLAEENADLKRRLADYDGSATAMRGALKRLALAILTPIDTPDSAAARKVQLRNALTQLTDAVLPAESE